MVGEALKGGRLVAAVMEGRGFRVTPGPHAPAPGSHARDGASARPSFITAVQLGSAERMVAFCRAVQRSSPVGAYVQPVPGARCLAASLHRSSSRPHYREVIATAACLPSSELMLSAICRLCKSARCCHEGYVSCCGHQHGCDVCCWVTLRAVIEAPDRLFAAAVYAMLPCMFTNI